LLQLVPLSSVVEILAFVAVVLIPFQLSLFLLTLLFDKKEEEKIND